MKIAIIGGGASALLIANKLTKYDVTIYERNKSLGRKLLSTGNGKCNLLNINAKSDDYNNHAFINKLFNEYSPECVLNYFKSLGLYTTIDEQGRTYPLSLSSQTVLDLLQMNLKTTKIITDTVVSSIKPINGKYQINEFVDLYDYIVLSSGSIASIIPAKQNEIYDYLKSLDLEMTPLKPSLVGFKVKEKINQLSGLRVKALVKLMIDGKEIHRESGEIIFKDDGISGIVIMNMSFYYSQYKGKNNSLVIDLIPAINQYKKSDYIGLIHPLLVRYINLLPNIDIKNFKLEIKDTYSFLNAQVVSGGINLKELNSNFSLIKYPHIFACGEVLDIDGICGGYNLLFAFASALKVSDELLKIV